MITVTGFLAVVFMIVAMLLALGSLEQSPAANRIRLAERIRSHFQFDSVGAHVGPMDGRMVLVVSYETTRDSKYNVSEQNREMREVADFAAAQYDDKDRRFIDEIRIKRVEIRSGGCWQRRLVAYHTAPNPHRTPLMRPTGY
jgi:hypothetical protein